MEKLFNWLSVAVGFSGGIFVFLFGEFDALMKALVVLVVLDYLTGIIKAIINKSVSSEIGYKGILKKVLIFIVIIVSVLIQNVLNNSVPIREIVLTFFVTNEAISLLENAAQFIPIPEKLKNVLLQLRNSNDTNEESEG
ncbi:MAG: phage holin family protein [Clostridiales bacterium]|nr:phage holin family protein [Clostridiales bacterium]